MAMQIGLALYSIRELLQKDYLGSLEKVAAIGYDCVELVNFPPQMGASFSATNKEIKNKIQELGLRPISSHVSLTPDADPNDIVSEVAETGSEAVVLPFANMNSMEEIKQVADLSNLLGEKCKERGMRFFYHNHFQEFVKVDGKYALDIFLEMTDPELVNIELDTFWVLRAGLEPIETIKKLGSRCKILHQKDLSKDAYQGSLLDKIEGPITMESMGELGERGLAIPTDIVEVGTGVMDIENICKAGRKIGSECIIVELDFIHKEDPFESLKISYDTLKKFA